MKTMLTKYSIQEISYNLFSLYYKVVWFFFIKAKNFGNGWHGPIELCFSERSHIVGARGATARIIRFLFPDYLLLSTEYRVD